MPRTDGAVRRREILGVAMDLASAEGLSGLSIGRLAAELGMSKSGLFAHFGSKEQLQLATVRFASEGYESDVIGVGELSRPGLQRLRALLAAWVDYIDGTANRGGCFFDASSSEFASRPGPVRDLLARLSRSWLERLVAQARVAAQRAELAPDTDPELLAFRLHAYVEEANWARELLDDERGFERARSAIDTTLRSALPQGATP